MEINQIIEFASQVPTWAWVVGVIAILIIFGDKKLWELEAKFPLNKGVGRGEVEIEYYKKKGAAIEVELTLEPFYQGKEIAVYLKRQLLITIPANKNHTSRVRFTKNIDLPDTEEGDEVSIKINNDTLFTAPLVRD